MNLTRIISIKERIAIDDLFKPDERDFILECINIAIEATRGDVVAKRTDLQNVHEIEHDGFRGTIQGHYTTREGKKGVVLQQVGTKVVHVYSEKWIKA